MSASVGKVDISKSDWPVLCAQIEGALEEMDAVFTDQFVPLAERPEHAKKIVLEHNLLLKSEHSKVVADDQRAAFMASAVRGRILVIIDEWFRAKYDLESEQRAKVFEATILLHGSPHPFRVPTEFSKPGDEPGTSWMSFPASVQSEETPTDWIVGSVSRVSHEVFKELQVESMATANAVRSISFSMKMISNGGRSEYHQTVEAVLADLQTAARELCSHDAAQTRNAAWHVSQATEKCLKLFSMTKGVSPPNSHDLKALARLCEENGAQAVDLDVLSTIPSGKEATDLRYSGEYSVASALTAYRSALLLIEVIAAQSMPKLEIDARNLRLLLKPPWFDFDISEFLKFLRQRQ
ncbi:HEPN domain-containing protein [Maricaulis salignorans]|uniref:HEPN domain-containing protein n=1 Tax=Maricaulis salignorans TaxID=144026 RepID=UPI003A924F51